MRNRLKAAGWGALAGFLAVSSQANATASVYDLTAATYSQDFNSIGTSGTNATLPDSFQFFKSGSTTAAAATDGKYVMGDGSSNTGNAYSFGTGTAADRAFGSLGSGTVNLIDYGFVFSNGLSTPISALSIAYTGEEWRRGTSTSDGLRFQYAIGVTSVNDSADWIDAAGLDFSPPNTTGSAGAVDGNAVGDFTRVTGTIGGLDIASGQTFAVRFVDVDSPGSDFGLAVDDFSLTATPEAAPPVAALPEPGSWALMLAGVGLLGASLRLRRRTRAALA